MPLNGDLRNYGITKLPSPSRTQVTYGNGKMGTSAACVIGWHLDEEILGNTWSVAMWVKPSSLGQYNNILFSKNISSSSDCQIYFSIMSNNALNLGINNHSSDITGAASFANGTWYHVAATYDGTTATIYLNGQELNHKTVSSTYSSNKLNINLNGRSSNATNTTYTGWFGSSYNDFRLYDNCISAAEVRELARGLVLHYKMGHQNIKPSLLQNGYNFTADNFALTRATVPEQGLLQITPTGSAAYAKYKTGLEYPDANNKRYVVSFDAQEIEPTNSSYTTDYIRFNYGFSGPSREDVIIGSADYYTYRNIQLLGTGWQHYVAIFTVPGPLASGDPAAMTDGATLAFQFGRRGSKKPLQVKNIKLELDSETIIYDSSGFGNHGETTGEIVYQTDTPRYNTCTHFEATNEKIKISNFPTSGFGDSYTFAWWAKADKLSIMHWGFNNGILLNGLYTGHLWNTGDSANNPLYVPGTTTQVTNPTINTWHHWVMTGDGTTCKVYQDGVHWGTAKTYKSISGSELYINGWDSSTNYSSSNFSVSDFRIYCTALDADAVKQLYELGAKIDKNHNTFTKEFREKPDGINKLYKTAIYETANLIENESGPSLSPVEWSYQPAANTNNASWGGVYADFSNVKDLGIPITVHCEYDISWNNVAPAAEGTFLARVQGSLAVINGSYDYWQGTNYLIPDSYSMTSDIRNNPTGTKHFSFTKTIPADWFQSYYLARIGFRVNYCDGNGTVSCSNVKITYQFDNTKIHSGAFITNQLIEN